MNTGNFLGISQNYGLRDTFLRFQRWVDVFEIEQQESEATDGLSNSPRPCRM